MDPCLVLVTISTPHNKPVLLVNGEIIRVVKETLMKRRKKYSRKERRIG